MCGIIGAAGNLTNNIERAVKDMLRLDVLRGPHSTGLAFVNSMGKISVAKKAMLPEDLLTTREATSGFQQVNKAIIGHNRWATKGAINTANAHPFEAHGIVGVHNGTVDHWRLPDSNKFDVDSECAINHIGNVGMDKAFDSLQGKFTFVTYNENTSELQFLRNPERPLHFVFTEDDKSVLFASEPWMISVAASRNGVKIKDILNTDVDTLYTFNLKGDVNLFTKKKLTRTFQPVVHKNDNYQSPHNLVRVTFADDLFIGDDLVFEVDSIAHQGQLSTVRGKCIETGINCCVYLNSTSYKRLIEELKKSTGYFIGRISSQVRKGRVTLYDHVVLASDSVEEYFGQVDSDDEDDLGDVITTPSGKVITRVEFEDPKRTSRDCAWCGDVIEFHKGIESIGKVEGKETYVCEHCCKLPDTKDYLF